MFNQFIYDWYGVEINDSDVYYSESVCDWSWGAVLIVFSQNGKFFAVTSDDWEPVEVSQEDALAEMLDFEEMSMW